MVKLEYTAKDFDLTAKQMKTLKEQGYVYITRNGKRIKVLPSKQKGTRAKKDRVKTMLLASSGSKSGLQVMVNKYFHSTNWTILPDNSLSNLVFSPEKNRVTNSVYRIIERNGRWRFEQLLD